MMIDRAELHPGLYRAAKSLCESRLTDGFCTPRNHRGCKCWALAGQIMEGTGLSAQAVDWIMQHRTKIEAAAEAYFSPSGFEPATLGKD